MEHIVRMRMNVAQEIMTAISMRHAPTALHHIPADVKQDLAVMELLVRM